MSRGFSFDMPSKAPRPCAHAGCATLTKHGRCEKHRKQADAEDREARGSAHERGYTAEWRKARAIWLREKPLCVRCMQSGRIKAALVVDHITPHRGDDALFWDRGNWQSLCKPCHDSKTMVEDKHK